MSNPALKNVLKQSSSVFRLKPIVIALSLISPLTAMDAFAALSPSSNLPTELNQANHRFHQDHVLGTSLDVVMTGANAQQAEKAFHAVQQEIARLDQILSTWNTKSEISALNRNKEAQVSPELFDVIAACESWRSKSCGAFDARLGQLIGFWEKNNNVHQLDESTRQHVLQQIQQQPIHLDAQQKTVQLDKTVTIAPDAYAKGYIIDRALIAARQAVPSLQGLMIDIGGDLRVWGEAPQKSGWKVGIQSAQAKFDNALPEQVLNLNNQAIAFSGKGYRDLAGQSHLLDPKTGLPLQHVEQCIVVGHCAADADALATALAAMSPEEGMALIESLIGYEAKMTLSNGDGYQTTGWGQMVEARPQAEMLKVAAGASSSWPAGYQAILELVIPKIAVENYRIPYVSVWITDSNKKLVKTLAVWGKDEKWINSNYVWWRRYGRQMPNLDAVAKPSRQPGQYKLAWDGKDETGKAVAAGQYIVHVETSREHGEHSYQTFDLDVKAKASSQTLPAQKEIGALKLNFQKVN
ncbi:DUF2271 domain-containing protein [Acinetobacter sp. S40]|uniref:DUF2271 domain-containing protein n=1 Tax=Acinetobacter sp. S40 TaxID=2767434 RepID=UPI00190C6798|nr:DUF2271 domain-containing protein [Acinetobacter sp. S40]MBJ9985703.1 DUF2271 domain-containing protein [Acinetobacter sp. S40]